MGRVLGVFIVSAMIFTSSFAVADDCEDAGRIGMMLGQIDRQCGKYRLTDKGRSVMLNMAARSAALGGEMCAAKGKAAMLREFNEMFPDLRRVAASGNVAAFNHRLCDLIATYLSAVGLHGGASLIENAP